MPTQIPVIDLTRRANDPGADRKLACSIDSACREIVNLGDLMARWTNDRWRSTAHRVAVPSEGLRENSQRLSIGFFVGPNYDAIVQCLPGCASERNPSRYAPISVHDYRTARFAAGAGIQNRDADRPAPHPATV